MISELGLTGGRGSNDLSIIYIFVSPFGRRSRVLRKHDINLSF